MIEETEETTGGNKPLNDASNKELIALVKKVQEELKAVKEQQALNQGGPALDIAKAIAMFQKEKDLDFRKGIRSEEIPHDDYDEAGITFCAPLTGYVVVDDVRKGHYVTLPYNKHSIFFEYQGTRRFQQGKYEQLAAFSTYVSHSKIEQKWMREHTFYRTMFYESTTDLLNFDVLKAQKLSRIMNMLKSFEFPTIIARCKDYGVNIGEDIDVMRTQLAFKMAEKELESEQTATQRRLGEIEKEKALLMAK